MTLALALVFLLVSLLTVRFARALLRRSWRHWQNLNELPAGRLGSGLRHGRAWLHLRDHLAVFRVEWSFLRRSTLGLGFEVSDGDGPEWQWSCGIGIAALYFSITSPKLRRFVPREGRSFRLALHDGAVWLHLWAREFETRYSDPWWIRGVRFHPLDFLLGVHQHSERQLEALTVLVPMPERPYRGTVTMVESTWKRPRWPFATRLVRAKIEMEDGEEIPTPGKGENSWDCGEDATHGLTTTAASVPAAIAAMVETVLERRARYGGRDWRPAATG